MKSFRKQNIERQTAFRLAVLENGYTPTPNVDKRCFYEGWSELETTEDMILSWRRKLGFQATGIIVRDGLCAIDVDIDDEEIVNKLWDRATKTYPQLREALVRFGSGAKEAWFCRVDEPFSVIVSTAHARPGEDPEGVGVVAHKLEAFGGGHPRQMGSYGAHTMKDDDSGFEIEYTWADDESPADVRLDALPLIPKSAVLAIAEMACEELEKRKWPRVKHSKSGEVSSRVVYDLTDDMLFDCLDGRQRTLEELSDYATTRNPRCSGSWMGDPTLVNRTRCLISTDHEGVVTVLETASWERHMPASEEDRHKPVSEKVSTLTEKLQAAGYSFDEEMYNDAPLSFREVTLKMLEQWAWCGNSATPCVPIYRDESLSMGVTNMRLTHLRHAYEREGPRGGVVKINPVDAWLNHGQREDVDGYRFMPHRTPGIYHQLGIRAINSYHKPVHPEPETDTESYFTNLWYDFVDHLLPEEQERDWFLDWLAHKVQNPEVPGVAVLMVARVFGVGRGTLFEIIEHLFTQRYVASVTADTLMGNGSQSQYTDWMANKLFITVDEILPEGDDGGSMAWRRKKAYEKLKERIDPKPRQMQIVQKGKPNYNDIVYATFIMATNHENALPIPEGDRRIVVLSNNDVKLDATGPLIENINRARNPEMDPQFISVIHRTLMERDVSDFNAHVAKRFKGKVQMLEANVTEFDSIVVDALEGMPYDWAALDAVLQRVNAYLIKNDLRDTYPKWRNMATDVIRQHWYFVGRHYVASKPHRQKSQVIVREARMVEQFQDIGMAQRTEEFHMMMRADQEPSAKLVALRKGIESAT
jgi:hypothetical protein